MKRFQKKIKDSKELPSFFVRFLMRINTRLMSYANWLQGKTNDYSKRKIKLLLFIFCAVFITESLVVLCQSFHKQFSKQYAVSSIKILPLLQEKKDQARISEKEFKRIHRFKLYLDSIKKTSKGHLMYDSFLIARPHIMDTLLYLENLYQQKLKSDQYGK